MIEIAINEEKSGSNEGRNFRDGVISRGKVSGKMVWEEEKYRLISHLS